jgi:hypothetical protein
LGYRILAEAFLIEWHTCWEIIAKLTKFLNYAGAESLKTISAVTGDENY